MAERILSASPHLRTDDSVPKIMWTVVLALAPTCAYSVYLYGWYAATLIAVCVATAVATEAVIQRYTGTPVTVSDGSAVVMGLLVACNIPPSIGWWQPMIGTIVGMAIAKQCFGGLGFNIFNPALIARAFMLTSFPQAMTKWTIVGKAIEVDATTTATPLGVLKEVGSNQALIDYFGGDKWTMYRDMFIGNIGGCIGETSALLILAGGVLMLIRGIISWHIPVAFLATLAATSALFGADPLVAVLAGGAMIGALFMATDMVTSPFTYKGKLIFGVGCGFLTALIRKYGGYPEGVSYAILLMNATVPLIDRYFPNRVFGTK